ncbi:fucolectin-1-like [Haliotis rubra]|uniref:fucolectin-1-like n=1 Tax=Haliotis rubra TaxID=36100 RepID=UPI001EE5D8FC|nr:fucolectin-1-like [Haliotis rubra]
MFVPVKLCCEILAFILHYVPSVGAYCLDNVALGQPAVQSGNDTAGPERAVDGNGALLFQDLSCTFASSSTSDPLPWWRVDLQSVVNIEAVTIATIRSKELDWRLHNFDIEVFSADPVSHPGANGQMCFSFFGKFGNSITQTLRCMYPVEGRYVRIKKRQHLNDLDGLTLCEVAVHPKLYENNCSFSYRSCGHVMASTSKSWTAAAETAPVSLCLCH